MDRRRSGSSKFLSPALGFVRCFRCRRRMNTHYQAHGLRLLAIIFANFCIASSAAFGDPSVLAVSTVANHAVDGSGTTNVDDDDAFTYDFDATVGSRLLNAKFFDGENVISSSAGVNGFYTSMGIAYFTASGSGNAGMNAVGFQPSDIMSYDAATDTAVKVVDASAAGNWGDIESIDALHRRPNSNWLISLSSAAVDGDTVGGSTTKFKRGDIIEVDLAESDPDLRFTKFLNIDNLEKVGDNEDPQLNSFTITSDGRMLMSLLGSGGTTLDGHSWDIGDIIEILDPTGSQATGSNLSEFRGVGQFFAPSAPPLVVDALHVFPLGDFDIDSDVDGFDFLEWQRGESPDPLSASDLADWEANYGYSLPLSATSAAVPEPATGVMLMLAIAGMFVRRGVADPRRSHPLE